MADQDKLSLHAQIVVKLAEDWNPGPIDIIAHSAAELIETIRQLKAHEAELGGAVAPQPEPAPQAQQEAAQPAPTPGPTAAQAAPAPTAPAAATAPDAGSAGTPTAPAPAQDSTQEAAPTVSLSDVLSLARQLLQKPGGEDTLGQILQQSGCTSISTADPKTYPQIFNGISTALAQ